MEYSIAAIEKYLGGSYKILGGKEGKSFSNLRPTLDADHNSLVFIAPDRKDKEDLLKRTKASIIICDSSLEKHFSEVSRKCLIIVDNPKLVFSRIGNGLFVKRPSNGRHQTAFVHEEAQVHPECYIGPYTYVGRSRIDKGCIIYGHCFIYDDVSIGPNVIIHAGCVIGADGFGYNRDENKEYVNFPHIGTVQIEKNVEIGANTCIDRGSLGATIVREGAKIDNLVHIAHNVVIGRHSAIIADAMIGGSTVIGDYTWISPSVALRDAIKVGTGSLVGMGAVVTKDVPDGETWTGNPAKPLKEFQRQLQALKRLASEEGR